MSEEFAIIGASFGFAYALVNMKDRLPPMSIWELLLWGEPGPYPDGDRLPLVDEETSAEMSLYAEYLEEAPEMAFAAWAAKRRGA